MGLIIDNFAGGGGASTGIETALGRPVSIAINHDPEAIAMHRINHPETRHYIENVWEIDPREVTCGQEVDLAWFSPDCTHFSKAKGGKPKDKNIRGLAWVAVKWAQQVRPKMIFLENVEEFKTWGPLNDDGQPIKACVGETFDLFIGALREQGYRVDFRELIACDYGTPTTRKRFFLSARCDDRPIIWPKKTHGIGLKAYRTAAECIDWSIPCPSIFDRPKALAENTLKRIAKGIVKYVLNNPAPFIVSLNHTADYYQYFRGQEIDVPLGTVTASNGFGVVVPHITKFRSGSVGHGIDEPMHTVTACSVGESNHPGGAAPLGLVAATLVKNNYRDRQQQGVDEPLHTITTQHNKFALVSAFLAKNYGGVVGSDIEAPIGTVTGIDHHSLVACSLMRQFGTSIGQALDEPVKTIMPDGGGKTALVAAFMAKYYGTNIGFGLDEPMQTLTSKDRFALVTVWIGGERYVIYDIGLRMLWPHELYLAQGFPQDYVIDPVINGKRLSKSAQVRMVGNSVCPPVAAALVRANATEDMLRIAA